VVAILKISNRPSDHYSFTRVENNCTRWPIFQRNCFVSQSHLRKLRSLALTHNRRQKLWFLMMRSYENTVFFYCSRVKGFDRELR